MKKWIASVLYAGLIMIMPISLMAQDVIKIGVLAPLDLPVGKGIQNGAEMAAEEINASGGILGKKVELLIADTKLKPVIGAYEYTRLATQEKVAAVLGTYISEVALAVIEQVPKHKVPFLSGSATPELTEKVKQNYDSLKYVFRTYFNSYEMADFSSEWLVSDLIKKRGLKRFALMAENANWARPVAAKWEKDIKDAGAVIANIEYFDKTTKDFKPIFARIAESQCEMICVLTAITEASAFLNQWTESKGPLMGGIIGSFRMAWKVSDKTAVSLISLSFPGIFPIKAKDMVFQDKYLGKYKIIPEFTSPHFYDALYMLKAAIERAKSVDPDAITDAMEKTDYIGVMGRWVFDKASHHSKFGPGYRQFMTMQWQPDGKACVIYPDEHKTCEMIFPQWK